MADQDVELNLLMRLIVMGVDVQKEGNSSIFFPIPRISLLNTFRNHIQNDP